MNDPAAGACAVVRLTTVRLSVAGLAVALAVLGGALPSATAASVGGAPDAAPAWNPLHPPFTCGLVCYNYCDYSDLEWHCFNVVDIPVYDLLDTACSTLTGQACTGPFREACDRALDEHVEWLCR